MRCVVMLAAVAGCWSSPRPRPTTPVQAPAPPPPFVVPTQIADCRADRLDVRDETVDTGITYREQHYQPMEMAASHHSHLAGGVLVLLIPNVDYGQLVQGIEARRFDVATNSWLPPVTLAMPGPQPLAPRYSALESGVVKGHVLVGWTDAAQRTLAYQLDVRSGVWTELPPTTVVPRYNGGERHPVHPDRPDGQTRVAVTTNGLMRQATFTRDGSALGTITFPSRPGAFIGAFANTRSGLLWNNQSDEQQSTLPPDQRHASYLVGLETGATCRVPRELVFPASAVFRTKHAIVFVNAWRTNPGRSSCPPGAPCKPPERSHFRNLSVTTLRDTGP